MTNPLRRRYVRDLRADAGKYVALFLLLVVAVGQVCGFQVADESLEAAYRDAFAAYNVEDGNFTVRKRLNAGQRAAVEAGGVRLNELFFEDATLRDGSRLRVFQNRQDMDRACVMDGRLAETPGEVAVDRMFARNHGLAVGDALEVGDATWTIVGLVALSDYSALFENNTDAMLDSLRFGVCVVSAEEFRAIPDDVLAHRYAWQYVSAPASEAERRRLSDELLAGLADVARLEGFVPREANQAIRFAGEDMGDTRAIMSLFFYLAIAVIAFVFGVLSSSTIARDAAVIGTLRATGFTRLELLAHYCAMPLLVTLAADAVGLALGCTVMRDVNAQYYYDNYSLPTYTMVWNPVTFAALAATPPALMLAINGLLLWRKLQLSPLRFLRRELTRGRGAVVRLSPALGFLARYRIRVVLRNLPNYVVLVAGILFAQMILMFGLENPCSLTHHMDTLSGNMLADYQYILRIPQAGAGRGSQLETLLRSYDFGRAVQTSDPDAEKFMAYTLRTPPADDYRGESVLLYGIDDGSRYVDLALAPGDVYVSSAYASKFGLRPGNKISLLEEYDDLSHTFEVDGIYEYGGALALFMPRADLNALLGLGADAFAGYFSRSRIDDIPAAYVEQVIDYDTLSKMSRQLMVSMQGLTNLMVAFSSVMFVILMYILSKVIVEQNARSISMAKVLGYHDAELNGLYVATTIVVALLGMVAMLPLSTALLQRLYEGIVTTKLNGWIPFYVSPEIYAQIVGMGFASCAVVLALEMRRIKGIPMSEALSDVD